MLMIVNPMDYINSSSSLITGSNDWKKASTAGAAELYIFKVKKISLKYSPSKKIRIDAVTVIYSPLHKSTYLR